MTRRASILLIDDELMVRQAIGQAPAWNGPDRNGNVAVTGVIYGT